MRGEVCDTEARTLYKLLDQGRKDMEKIPECVLPTFFAFCCDRNIVGRTFEMGRCGYSSRSRPF